MIRITHGRDNLAYSQATGWQATKNAAIVAIVVLTLLAAICASTIQISAATAKLQHNSTCAHSTW